MAPHAAAGADTLVERAPAKINLALHVTGQREDGYHLLDSIVTFAATGAFDELRIAADAEDRLDITGRFGPLLEHDAGQNLVTRARDRLRAALVAAGHRAPPVAITLVKNLPIASGIGGGSADAAAALRGLMRLWAPPPGIAAPADIALSLGADVPMCLHGAPLRARGIGEVMMPLALPPLHLVLVNPLVAVSTPSVFGALARRDNPPLDEPPRSAGDDWPRYLRQQRNDLAAPARILAGQIAEAEQLLEAQGAALVRMSGSGASCFGLFDSEAAAEKAERAITEQRPGWYVVATTTRGTP